VSALEEARRRLRSVAHRAADQTSARISEATGSRREIATVSTVVVGGAGDGRNLIKVTWRGGEVLAAGWNAAQTFAVGQRVMCDLYQGQLIVDFPIVGQP
jgi:uncharacterized protein (DUF697 family)